MTQAYERLARSVVGRWGFSEHATLTLLNLSENATFRVQEQDRRAILRVHRTDYQDEPAIRSELAWIAALRKDVGLLAPVPIPTADGDELAQLIDIHGTPRHAVLFEEIPGAEPPPDDLHIHLPRLGELAAILHDHVDTWSRPPQFTRFRWAAPELLGENGRWGRLREGLGVDDELYAVLRRARDQVVAELTRYGKNPDRFGLIHADMRLANLLVDGDQVAVIDFDDSGISWHLYDLAATLSFVEHDPRVPGWCQAWLDGYQRVRPLTHHDRSMVATFVMARRLVLVAWLGTHHDIPLAAELKDCFARDATTMAEQYLCHAGWSREVFR